MSYEDFRREYTADGLTRDMLDSCPVRQFETWLEQAVGSSLEDPTAMVLATVDARGLPWQRIVLLKSVSAEGFVFYTNYDSDKGRAIAAQPCVSLHFPWNALDRQVSLLGRAEKLSPAASASYFASRPRESQVAAWASRQSRPVPDRAALEAQAALVREKFAGREIPVPEFWGGYRVLPERMEFWQGGEHRLHNRFRYTRGAHGDWDLQQLQP
ncbi:MAG: pyridoxamine 5'-phosphate oxidase [Halioglobus sp.]|nr:pyridoxamine 5'-phosphate oxidase [Halioglobus sp.]